MSASLIAPVPFWAHYFLENPWPVAAVASLLAGLLMWLARQIARRQLAWSALVVALVGCLGTPLLAACVLTAREELVARTCQLVRAAGPVNPSVLRAVFDPQAVLIGPAGDAWLTVPEMLTAIESLDQHYSVGRHKLDILGVEARPGGVGVSQVDVVSHFERGPAEGRPLRTRWLLTWRCDPPGPDGREGSWRLSRAQWLKHPAPDAIEPQMGLWDQMP